MEPHLRLEYNSETCKFPVPTETKIVSRKDITLKKLGDRHFVFDGQDWHIITNSYYEQLAKILLGESNGST